MFKVKFYESFGKKLNSTKRPTVSDNFTEISVNMKTPSSIINPVIELTLTGAQVSNFRYAYIADFDRYYFINDKTFNNGFWVFSLSCDVLASWKNQISTFETVILRSSNQVNEYIPDSEVQLTGKYSFDITDLWGSYGTTWSTGVYVLSVLGRGNAPTVKTYQMTSAQFEQFVNTLYASVTNFTWGTLVQGQINNLYNPEEKIVSCYWFPKAFSTSGSDYITCGLWNSGIKGAIVDTSYDWSSYQVSVSQHPQASSMGKYLNLSPYTQHYVEMNTGEVIRIDGSLLMDVPSVAIENKTDPLTGLAIIEGLAIHGQGITSETLFKITVPWGVPINLAVGKNNLAGFITSALSNSAMVASGAPLLGTLGATVGLTNQFMSGIGGVVSNSSSVASIVHHGDVARWVSRFYEVADMDNATLGRPYCKKISISSIPGYIVCASGDITINGATREEIASISNYLTSGFYYE